jgi:non-ribosomal peptide synthetase component F
MASIPSGSIPGNSRHSPQGVAGLVAQPSAPPPPVELTRPPEATPSSGNAASLTGFPDATPASVHRLFERLACQYPERAAVIRTDETLTYGT